MTDCLFHKGAQARLWLMGMLCSFALLIQASPAPIKYLGIEQGLSNNSVRCIYQDHNGFMWFGTYDGLNRYDGYQFKVFRNKLNDTTSIPHNYIYTISEDQHNRLWVGTGQGTAVYDNFSSGFSPTYYISPVTGRKHKVTININTIKPDAYDHVLIGTNGLGLLIQPYGDKPAQQIPVIVGGKTVLEYNVPAIAIDKAGQAWIFINDVGLCTYNYQTKNLHLETNQVKSAARMIFSDDNHLWIGTSSGVKLFNTRTKTIEKIYDEPNGKLASNVVASLLVDGKNNLWIGTEGGGVTILNMATDSVQSLLAGEGSQMLSSESAYALFEDKDSRKWIGTLKGGINIIESRPARFQTISHQPYNPNSLIYNFVSCFYEDDDKSLWVGTDGGGMSIWNRLQNKFTNYQHQPGNAGSISSNLVTSIAKDFTGTYWVSTFGNGINQFNKATGVWKQYHCVNPATGAENKNVWRLYEDRQKNLWATTFSQGKLYRYNRATDRFDVFAPGAFDLVSFIEDANGTLWAGNAHELIQLNGQNGQFREYEIGKPVRAIYEDKKHNLWLGTEGGGLILFDRKKGQIEKRYSDADGLCNNSVLNILEDNKGNLWLSTFNGLSRFTPTDKSFKNFYGSDGLQSNQFSYSAALKLQSGELVFGGIKGFSLFNPDSLQFRKTSQALILTDLKINGEPIAANPSFISKTNEDKITAIKIPYDKATLTYEFAALEYSVANKITYAYYLEGWDKTWNYTGKLRTASYTRLKEGTYTLHMKATDGQGDWGPDQTLLTVTVLPPWYRSWWAYLIYGCVVAALIYLYNAYRVRQSKLEYEVKLAHVDAEKEKELNEKKMAFFTDISHEFRTPLTLIINPLKDFLKSDKAVEPGELNIVYRNASRLLNLVDQLLQFQKAGVDNEQLKISQLNFYQLCRDVYDSFVNQAKRKHIDYQFVVANEHLELYADREKMEIVLFNLLSNAMKFTPDGGKVTFTLSESDDDVTVAIADNGPGIPSHVGDKLFERFYRVEENRSSSRPGFGIGLYLVRHFINKHKGDISYRSQVGLGTGFYIQLQKGKAHLTGENIVMEEAAEKKPAVPQVAIPELVAAINNKPERKEPEELLSGKQSVLVVEDNPEIRQYVLSIFSDSYNVYEAENGNLGIRLAKQYLPDIIISDVMMPDGTGIELCNAVKNDTALSHIPVILLTAVSASDMKLKGLECGADDYITKPFEKELLLARVTNLLKKRTVLQNYFYNEVTLQQNNLKVSAEYKEFLDKCIAIVEAHLDDEQFSIKTLSMEIGMSHSNLYKKVKSISGQSVNAFIRFIRLRKAAELFINTNMNVNETAFEVGINDVKYFREQFNKLFGVNPSEYIKKYRKAFSSNYRVNKDAFGKENSAPDPSTQ